MTSALSARQVRNYGLDPSLLVDICRQNLVYETPANLCDGLAAILADPVLFDIHSRVADRQRAQMHRPPTLKTSANFP
jgi:hypothetical protein